MNEMRALRSLYGTGSARRMLIMTAVMFLAVFVLRVVDDRASVGIGLFYLVPVSLLALRFGVRGGLLGALLASVLYCGWSAVDYDGLPTEAFVSRSLMFFVVGGLVGYLSTAILDALSKFDIALGAAPIIIFTTDTQLRYTWLHDAGSGKLDHPLVGRTDYEILGPEHGRRPYALKARALETGEKVHDVYEVVVPNAPSFWFSVTVEPLRDGSGTIVGLSGAALDITAERHAAEALGQSEARFRSAAENQLEPFALYSPMRDELGEIYNFRCDFINQPGAESVGMKREDMVGKALSELFPGRLELGLLDEYKNVVETGEPLFREAIDFLDVLGEETLVRAFDVRVSKLDEGIQMTWRDITERARAERERDWIQALVENSPDAIMSTDLTGKVVSWSAGAEKMYGWPRAEVVGKPFMTVFPKDQHDERHERMRRIFAGQQVGPLRMTERRKDGTEFEAEYTAGPIFDADGVVIGAARIVREQPSGSSQAQTAADPTKHHTSS